MYVTLDRLRRKGYVRSKDEKGTPERGGKPKPFYHLEPAGLEAIHTDVLHFLTLTQGKVP